MLHVMTVVIVALPAALALAHALERPGKMRLDEATYRAVQRIYYPGFTVGGIAEVPAILATALLLFLTPAGTLPFWLVLAALAGVAGLHAIYWIAVHPVNRVWMEGRPTGASGAAFFRAGTGRGGPRPEWTELRDRWERAHVVRAVLGGLSLLALVIALAVGR